MSQTPRVLFIVPPIRPQGDEFEYLIHLPRHAIVLAAELCGDFEIQILDVTAEFHVDPKWAEIAAGDPGNASSEPFPLAPVMRELVINRIAQFHPDIIVVHAHAAPHLPIVKQTFDAILEILPEHPNAKVVCGGMAATHLTQAIADWAPDGAWIIRGEGTGRVRDLFSLVLGNRQVNPSKESVNKIKGRRRREKKWRHIDVGQLGNTWSQVLYQAPDTTAQVVDIIGNPPIMDYPLPRYDLLPMKTYTQLFQSGDFVPHLEMSSGCTYRCKFCGVHYLGAEGRFRRRPVANVVEEMRYLRNAYGFDEFYFCDETFTLDKKHARELCKRMIEELPGIRWRCVTRVDKVDDEIAHLMFSAGCFEVGFGVEVGNNDVLQQNTKDATVDLNVATIKRVQCIGIDANALTIIGMPQEDHCDIRRTFEFLARDAKPNRCQIFVFHPVPGTPYFDEPELYGLRFDTRDVNEWYKWDHIGEAVCETKYLSKDDIARYFMLFNRAFATVIDGELDLGLIERVLQNQFPVRRKGVTWRLENGVLRVYRPIDPSRNILNNSVELSFSPGDNDEPIVDRVAIANFLLCRCDGETTREELAQEVKRVFQIRDEVALATTDEILDIMQNIDVVTEF